MKVLFVSSSNSVFGISPIVRNQGESLKKTGVDLEFFPIKGKGIRGYLKNISKLRRYLSDNKFDLVHAHYSLSGVIAVMAGSNPLIISLMGSDVQPKFYLRLILLTFKLLKKTLIVKSESMKKTLEYNKLHVIPNGVNLEKFSPIDQRSAKKKTGFDLSKKHIIFVSDPERAEKNFKLTSEAFELIKKGDLELKVVKNTDPDLIPYFMNAADILVLTSLWEGSPNVIKEAMACNCPIVSTDVGDVREIIGNTAGCYISTFEPKDVAEKLGEALAFGERTNGRQKIKYLDEKIISGKIAGIYQNLKLK